jgi:hypothetical protein
MIFSELTALFTRMSMQLAPSITNILAGGRGSAVSGSAADTRLRRCALATSPNAALLRDLNIVQEAEDATRPCAMTAG